MTISIFQYQDYKQFVLDKIREYPSRGHGVFKQISVSLRIPTSTLSLVFRGDRELTAEQAIEFCEFLGLSPLETDYFMILVEKERAGNTKLSQYVEEKMGRTKRAAENLSKRIPSEKVVGPHEKYVFYSEWYYSSIRLLSAIPGFQTADVIAKHLGLPETLVQGALDFLKSCGLCVEENGEFRMGPGSTHVGPEDPLAFRHLLNWHTESVHRLTDYPKLEDHELCISIPCSTSAEALKEIKQIFLDATLKAVERIDKGQEERLAFINIDLLEGRKNGRKKA